MTKKLMAIITLVGLSQTGMMFGDFDLATNWKRADELCPVPSGVMIGASMAGPSRSPECIKESAAAEQRCEEWAKKTGQPALACIRAVIAV